MVRSKITIKVILAIKSGHLNGLHFILYFVVLVLKI